jgi:AcrR family transcriptional regulator
LPSATFFHLPTEKRETLLRAARHEFARVPFDEASINRIIREAGIPRGSFYMYFQHKEDLFQYVMGLYAQQLVGLFSRLLEEARGDLFSAFQALFQTFLRLRGDAEILEFQNILRCNAGMRQGALLGVMEPTRILESLSGQIDTTRLDLREGEELGDMFHILVSATGPFLCAALFREDTQSLERRFSAQMQILRRGMERPRA